LSSKAGPGFWKKVEGKMTEKNLDLLVLGTINASLPREISAWELAGAIRSTLPSEPWRSHLIAMFTEVSINLLDRFLARHEISTAQALECFEKFVRPTDPKPDVEEWLRERKDLEISAA
jgi:hypothetical protein